ncbi:hypothetical protein JCM5296_003495 [Sporobolomyces johnsonii]
MLSFSLFKGRAAPAVDDAPAAGPPKTRAQRAFRRISTLSMSSVNLLKSSVPSETPAPASPTSPRCPPSKLRRKSSFASTAFSSSRGRQRYASSASASTTLTLSTARTSVPSVDHGEREHFKRGISSPIFVSTSAPVSPVDHMGWGTRDALRRLAQSDAGSAYEPSVTRRRRRESFVSFVREPWAPGTPHYDDGGQAWRESFAESLQDPTFHSHSHDFDGLDQGHTEISRFSLSSEDLCRPFLDAPGRRDSDDSVSLDFDLSPIAPRSPPPSPAMYKKQPVVHSLPPSPISPTATWKPRAQRSQATSSTWSTFSSDDDDLDEGRGFSFASTPALALLPSPVSASFGLAPPLTPPTPRLRTPKMDLPPSPLALPPPADEGRTRTAGITMYLQDLEEEFYGGQEGTNGHGQGTSFHPCTDSRLPSIPFPSSAPPRAPSPWPLSVSPHPFSRNSGRSLSSSYSLPLLPDAADLLASSSCPFDLSSPTCSSPSSSRTPTPTPNRTPTPTPTPSSPTREPSRTFREVPRDEPVLDFEQFALDYLAKHRSRSRTPPGAPLGLPRPLDEAEAKEELVEEDQEEGWHRLEG